MAKRDPQELDKLKAYLTQIRNMTAISRHGYIRVSLTEQAQKFKVRNHTRLNTVLLKLGVIERQLDYDPNMKGWPYRMNPAYRDLRDEDLQTILDTVNQEGRDEWRRRHDRNELKSGAIQQKIDFSINHLNNKSMKQIEKKVNDSCSYAQGILKFMLRVYRATHRKPAKFSLTELATKMKLHYHSVVPTAMVDNGLISYVSREGDKPFGNLWNKNAGQPTMRDAVIVLMSAYKRTNVTVEPELEKQLLAFAVEHQSDMTKVSRITKPAPVSVVPKSKLPTSKLFEGMSTDQIRAELKNAGITGTIKIKVTEEKTIKI